LARSSALIRWVAKTLMVLMDEFHLALRSSRRSDAVIAGAYMRYHLTPRLPKLRPRIEPGGNGRRVG